MGSEKEKEIWDITIKGISGEINWEEGLKQRVHALRGIDYDRAYEIAQSLGNHARSKTARVLF